MTSTMTPRRRLAFAWLLAAALLLAQTLGLAHQVLHAPGALSGANESALFGHHDGAECQLFDHLSHGDMLVAAALPLLPDRPGVAPDGMAQAGVAHACSTVYSARAPPRG